MRPIQSVLLPLVLLVASAATAAAQNVCVHGADGGIVCGPVANAGGNGPGAGPGGGPNPWDKPAQNFRPSDRPGPFVERRPLPRRAVHEAGRRPPPRQAYREPPPSRDFERRPPPRQAGREDMRRRYSERDFRQPPPPPQTDRMRTARYPARYPDMQQRRYDDGPGRAGMIDPRYEARLRELEREIRELRGERDRYALPPPPRAPRHTDRYTAND